MSKLTPEQIHAIIKEEFGAESVSDLDNSRTMPNFTVLDHSLWQPIAYFMRTDDRLKFDYLACLSGVDYNDGNLATVYNLESISAFHHKIAVKLRCTKENNTIPSVAEIWRTAEWHEREAYDLVGIIFDGNPDLRRILCPDDWEGHPLRKDYKVQEYYHGIKVPY